MIQSTNSIDPTTGKVQKEDLGKNVRSSAKSLQNYWKSNEYSTLLNSKELKKAAKRNIWQVKVKQMLHRFTENMEELNQVIKFKMSGKVLNSSTYLLKNKTHSIINSSEETQEEIDKAQQIEKHQELENENEIDGLNNEQRRYENEGIGREDEMPLNAEEFDDSEIFEAFEELKEKDLLDDEQIKEFNEAKVEHILNLDPKKLTEKIENSKKLIDPPPKFIYKKVQFHDLANALSEVLNEPKEKKSKKAKKKEKNIDKAKVPFLPDNFISKAENKRQNFEAQIDDLYRHLKRQFTGEPIGFLQLIKETNQEINVKAIVDTLLIVLHLINHQKVELWKSYIKENNELKERTSEDNGSNIYLSPQSQKTQETEKKRDGNGSCKN
ncbi:MAG: hypothetical protein R6U96_08920 [Promethearchaeia archaeon]